VSHPARVRGLKLVLIEALERADVPVAEHPGQIPALFAECGIKPHV